MPFDLSALEDVVLTSPPDSRPELPALISDPPAPEPQDVEAAPVELDLMSEAAWNDQWGLLHDMAGGMVHMRTGAPCPLGDQARSEGGMIASQAAYSILAGSPALARLFLSTESTFIGQIAAIGMHGFSCVQVVKASASGATIAAQEHSFKSSRNSEAEQ